MIIVDPNAVMVTCLAWIGLAAIVAAAVVGTAVIVSKLMERDPDAECNGQQYEKFWPSE